MRFLEMTPDEYAGAKEHFEMDTKEVMQTFGVARSTAYMWEKNGPPQSASMFLRLAFGMKLSLDQAIEICAGHHRKP